MPKNFLWADVVNSNCVMADQRPLETACTVLGGCAMYPRVDRRLNTGRVCDTVLLQTYDVYKDTSAVGVGEHRICGPCCC